MFKEKVLVSMTGVEHNHFTIVGKKNIIPKINTPINKNVVVPQKGGKNFYGPPVSSEASLNVSLSSIEATTLSFSSQEPTKEDLRSWNVDRVRLFLRALGVDIDCEITGYELTEWLYVEIDTIKTAYQKELSVRDIIKVRGKVRVLQEKKFIVPEDILQTMNALRSPVEKKSDENRVDIDLNNEEDLLQVNDPEEAIQEVTLVTNPPKKIKRKKLKRKFKVSAKESQILLKKSKNELIDLCNSIGVKTSGTKVELVKRYLSFERKKQKNN